MDRTGSLSARMKGGGGVGVTGGGRGEGESHSTPSRPYPPGIHPGGKTLILACVYPVIMSSISADCHRQFFFNNPQHKSNFTYSPECYAVTDVSNVLNFFTLLFLESATIMPVNNKPDKVPLKMQRTQIHSHTIINKLR